MRTFILYISTGLAVALPSASHASDYGCRVLLCLANPSGPTALAECKPPIDRLRRDLERGRGFPSCDEGKPALAQMGYSAFDPCPEGTLALPSGEYALLQPLAAVTPPAPVVPAPDPGPLVPVIPTWSPAFTEGRLGSLYLGVGDLAALPPNSWAFTEGAPTMPQQQVCVGSLVSNRIISVPLDNDGNYAAARAYDRVVLMDPVTTPRYVDITIDGKLYRRARW